MSCANSLFLWWRHLASYDISVSIAVCSWTFFFLFTICSPAIMVPNGWPSGHPKYIPSYKRKNIYVYIYRYDILEDPGQASSLYSLR